MTIEQTDQLTEPLEEGGTWLLDVVAAVDYLRRGIRPGITVWDALEEALRWTVDDADDWDDTTDPLGMAIIEALAASNHDAATTIQAAIRHWGATMADRYNDGHHWPHPVARRGFPPPEVPLDIDLPPT